MKITEYDKSSVSFGKLQNELKVCMDEALFLPNEAVVCFHLLNCLEYDLKHTAITEKTELIKASKDFKEKFKSIFGYWNEANPSTANPSIFQQVLFNVFDFELLPFRSLSRLEAKVKDDLGKRQELLKFYREHKYIQEYERTGEKPRDQNEKTLLVFFNRNVDEQQKILDYFLTKMKKRAIARAKGTSVLTAFADDFYDWPYVSGFPNTEKYFDHREIDLVSHRLMQLELKKLRVLREVYYKDKAKFYEDLKVDFPPAEVYRLIRYYVGLLTPLSDKRAPIFEELIKLFERRSFYGFYALALSQIEGIFSELVIKINPQTKKGSLPEKVNYLRQKFEKEGMNLDYYEHYIPLLRNKFMHTGLDDDIEIKAHDLLYDLPHLLTIYTGVTIPIIELTQLIKRRDHEPYFSVDGFVNYFRLMDATNCHEDRKTLQPVIDAFEKDFLSEQDLDFLSQELESKVPATIKKLWDFVKEYTKINSGKEVNMDMKTTHLFKQAIPEMLNELRDVFESQEDEFRQIENYRIFLSRCEKYIPNMPQTARDRFKLLATKGATDFEKAKMIIEEFEKEKQSLSK